MALNTKIIISAQDRASSVFGKVAGSSSRSSKQILGVNSALKRTSTSVEALDLNTSRLATSGGLLALAAGLKSVVQESLAVKIDFDRINNTLKAIAGSSEGAGAEMGFLASEAQRLGVELRPLAFSYSRLAAAGKQLGLQTDDTREIFTAFSEAITGLGLGRGESIGVFTAIEQILSKGKVSAEELRQQLGERLPGAFQLAAKAAGVTVQELDGLLKKGTLLSSDFILPFARLIKKEFGGAAVTGAKLLNAEFNRTINVLDKAKLSFIEGDKAGNSLADSLAHITKSFAEFLGNEQRLQQLADAGTTLGEALEGIVDIGFKVFKVFEPVLNTFSGLIGVFDKGTVGVLALAAAMKSTITVGKTLSSVFGVQAVSQIGATTAEAASSAFTLSRGLSSRRDKIGANALGSQRGTAIGPKLTGLEALNKSLLGTATSVERSQGLLKRAFLSPIKTLDSLSARISRSSSFKALDSGLAKVGSSFINVLGPIGALAAAATAAAAVLANLQETRNIRKNAEGSILTSDTIQKELIPAFNEALKSIKENSGSRKVLNASIKRTVELFRDTAKRQKEFLEIDKVGTKNLNSFASATEKLVKKLEDNLIPAVEVIDWKKRIQEASQKLLDTGDVDLLRAVRNQLGVSAENFKGALEKAATDLLTKFSIEDTAKALKGYAEQLRKNAEVLRGQKNRAKDKENAKKKAEKRSDFLDKANRSADSLSREADFIKKFGEQNLFKFKIQEKFNQKVLEGLITQEEANRLSSQQIAAQQKLNSALNKKASSTVASGFSATTVQDSGFQASRAKERTRQLFQSRDKAKEKSAEKAKKEKDKLERDKLDVAKANGEKLDTIADVLRENGFDIRIA